MERGREKTGEGEEKRVNGRASVFLASGKSWKVCAKIFFHSRRQQILALKKIHDEDSARDSDKNGDRNG